MQTAFLNQKAVRVTMLGSLYLSGPIFLALTNPHKLPIPLLMLPFMWMFVVLFVTAWVIVSKRESLSRRKIAMVSGVIASIPVLLAVFQSIHQLSARDVLISVGLVVLAVTYMLRADFIK